MTTADKQILFACTQNAVRSVMAKGLFETKFYSTAGRAVSCGLIEGPLDGFVVAVLREKGIDVSRHEAQVFEALDPANFGLIVSFTREAEDGIRDRSPSRGLGDVYKRQIIWCVPAIMMPFAQSHHHRSRR